ncbi:MAG: hypothetical protein JW719_04510, partial [Pirellulales bacterium]|nr:hypothetical protein [Pirellulales bacterium]
AYIPTGVGALICLLVVYGLPRRRHQVLIVAGILALVATAWLGWSLLTGPRAALLTPEWFQQTVTRLQFSQQQMLPSWWLSAGLLETAHHGWDQGMLFFCVLAANALMLRQAAVWIAGRWYRTAYGQLRAMSTRRKQTKHFWLDRVILVALPCPLPFRLMLLKDLRLFRRDASQWSQFLLFFALLGFYFLNLRQFEAESRTVGWDNMMSFVNLTVVGLILSTLTTRHVYPMISLEIRRMWLLGLLGVDRSVIVWSKLVFAMGAALVPCALLVLASDMMLGISLMLQVSHQATCLLLCLGLCSMAVGLGARMPNLQEDSPPRIAAGFGGTLNLVIGAGYIVLIVMLAAMPWHLHALASQPVAMDYLESRPGFLWWLRLWLWGGSLGSVLLTFVATFIPLRSGFRAFRLMEP